MTPTWRDAWELAHYGPHGFYRTNPDPSVHFRTAVMDSPETAHTIFTIAREQYQRLGSPHSFTLLDCGGGTGELARDLQILCGQHELSWNVTTLNFTDGDVRDLSPVGGAGVVIAHELLDDIPCQVVELDDHCLPHVMHVDPATGTESLGGSPSAQEQEWLATWWPATVPGARREIGIDRDRLWHTLLTIFDSGCAILVDYCTTHSDRLRGVWDAGTLAGYQSGRITRAVPDGHANITAHVCIESLIDVGRALGAPPAQISRPDPHSDFHWLVQQL